MFKKVNLNFEFGNHYQQLSSSALSMMVLVFRFLFFRCYLVNQVAMVGVCVCVSSTIHIYLQKSATFWSHLSAVDGE